MQSLLELRVQALFLGFHFNGVLPLLWVFHIHGFFSGSFMAVPKSSLLIHFGCHLYFSPIMIEEASVFLWVMIWPLYLNHLLSFTYLSHLYQFFSSFVHLRYMFCIIIDMATLFHLLFENALSCDCHGVCFWRFYLKFYIYLVFFKWVSILLENSCSFIVGAMAYVSFFSIVRNCGTSFLFEISFECSSVLLSTDLGFHCWMQSLVSVLGWVFLDFIHLIAFLVDSSPPLGVK